MELPYCFSQCSGSESTSGKLSRNWYITYIKLKNCLCILITGYLPEDFQDSKPAAFGQNPVDFLSFLYAPGMNKGSDGLTIYAS